jgi:tight adherence protein B
MALFVTFVAILSVTFGVMAFAAGASHSQTTIEQRIMRIGISKDKLVSNMVEIEQLLKVDPAKKFGWIDGFLQKYRISHMLETRIAQSNSKISVVMLILFSVGLAILGFAVTSLCVSFLAIQIVVACALGCVPFGIVSFKRSRRISAFNAGLPDAIDMMGRSLRAGHSMVASINIVAEQSVDPVRTEFHEVFKQQNFGLPLRDALMQMLSHVPSQDLRVLVTGILVQKETGGNLAEILDRTGTVVRERMRIQGEIRTHTAQGRLTGYILCSLPVIMLLVINFINPGYSNALMNTPVGHKLICIGIFLLAAGAMAIRHIINGIEV